MVGIALALTACGGAASVNPTPSSAASPSVAASASEAPPAFVLVVIGDSIPFNSQNDCPGCTGFVDSYAEALGSALGRPVEVVNRSRHDGANTADIIEQLGTDNALLDSLARADMVVTSAGFNDQPPFPDAHDGCPPATGDVPLETLVERAAATSTSCMDSVVVELRQKIATVFGTVREHAPDATLAALTSYDSWIGWPELAALDEDTVNRLYDAERYWQHHWRDAMCAEAEAVDAVCVDVYTAFNGPDGSQPATEFVGADHTHPSQKGNDMIRDLLLSVVPPAP